MINKIIEKNQNGLEWIEVINPSIDEITHITEGYKLPATAVQDCLEPNHLPKFEEIEGFNFMIFRVFDSESTEKATTVQALTRKVAVFHCPDLIITIQRSEISLMNEFKNFFSGREKHLLAEEILVKLIEYSLLSFEKPAINLIEEINNIENLIFFERKTPPILEDVYYIKKRSDAIERMLILYRDILSSAARFLPKKTYLRDVQDLHLRLENLYKTILDNTGYLINVYFSLSSQRTNEIMQVLTLFSAFFLPLTFIAGVYGMNFEYMPELKMSGGYFGTWLVMIGISIGIYVWFKNKGWI
jgi:magnesium transporter